MNQCFNKSFKRRNHYHALSWLKSF